MGTAFLDNIGTEVTLVETLDRSLANSYDPEFSQMAEEKPAVEKSS